MTLNILEDILNLLSEDTKKQNEDAKGFAKEYTQEYIENCLEDAEEDEWMDVSRDQARVRFL